MTLLYALLTAAFLFTDHSCTKAMTLKKPRPYQSSFVLHKVSLLNDNVTTSRYQQFTRRRVACSLTQYIEEEDASFFVRASQQAAQERMQNPVNLAISLSSTSQIAPKDDKDMETAEGSETIVAVSEKGGYEEKLKIPSTNPKSPLNYHFQRNLLEARFLMDKQEKSANAANAGKLPEISSENQERHTITAVETNSSSVTAKESDLAHPPLDSKKDNMPMEPQVTTNARLSSDGKKIFEPSPASLEADEEENVTIGLLVLTRAYLALGSILNKKG